jgi:hypothetical protein
MTTRTIETSSAQRAMASQRVTLPALMQDVQTLSRLGC